MALYLSQLGSLHLSSPVVGAELAEGASKNTPSLFAPPLLPVWLSRLLLGYWVGQKPQQAGPHVTYGAQTWITESTESLRKLGKE